MSWNRFLTTRSWRLTQGNGHWLCLPEAQWNYPQSYQHSLRFPVFFCPTSLHKVKKCPTQLNMSGKSKPGLVVDSFQNEGRKVDGRVGQSDVWNCQDFFWYLITPRLISSYEDKIVSKKAGGKIGEPFRNFYARINITFAEFITALVVLSRENCREVTFQFGLFNFTDV